MLLSIACTPFLIPAGAAQRLQAAVDAFEHPFMTIQGARLQLGLDADLSLGGQLRADRLSLTGVAGGRFQDVELRCRRLRIFDDGVHCRGGEFRAQHAVWGTVSGQIHLQTAGSAVMAEIAQLTVLGLTLQLDVRVQPQGTRVVLRGKDVALAAAGPSLKALGWLNEDLSEVAGVADVAAELRMAAGGATELQATIAVRDVAFLGTHAAEELAAKATLQAELRNDVWEVQLGLRHTAGALYVEPGFTVAGVRVGFTLEAPVTPVELDISARWQAARQRLYIDDLRYSHHQVLALSGSAELDLVKPPMVRQLDLGAVTEDLAGLYAVYLQPLLLGTSVNELELAGAVSARLSMAAQGLEVLELQLDQVYFDDKRQRFRGFGVNGQLGLSGGDRDLDSALAWDGGGLLRVDLGPGRLSLRSHRGRLELLTPLTIPVLGGEFRVNGFALDGLGRGDLSVDLQAELTPVPLPEFTQAMDWPIMSGNLSGELPDLHYSDGNLIVGGTLVMRAFDGALRIANLTIEDLFGLVPELRADVEIQDLDLEVLTRTFSFGKIEGRLEGRIADLYLQSWQPVSFDAYFGTPGDDDSRHRISQKALNNLTSIGGGGAAAALSQGFIGFFDEFSYERIALGCRLRGGVCLMSGIDAGDDGYYIVKRGLLPPWIDVKGFNRRVDWPVLVERIRAVSRSSGPVVR